MNARAVMTYGHGTVLGAVEHLPAPNWMDNGVCGVWSTRDLLAHLATYELVLGDILVTFTGGGPTPDLDQFLALGTTFNDRQVEIRQAQTGAEALAEYTRAYARVADLALRIPEETWREVGTIPWYGPEYSLDDLITYQFYGHKREHCAQIAVFRDSLGQASPSQAAGDVVS
jgi:uncharacterized damage-inducible protein DinB